MTSLRHKSPTNPAPDGYLDAARAVILDVGWKRSTLTEVARRAGVSRMTIYRAWPDMERLFSDLLTREWLAMVEEVVGFGAAESDPGDRPQAPDVERLVDALVGTVAAMRTNPLFRRVLDVDPETLLPYLLARRGRSQDAVIGLLTERIRAAQAAGEVRAGDALLIARSLVLLCHGFALSVDTMADDGITRDDLDAELRHTLVRALQP